MQLDRFIAPAKDRNDGDYIPGMIMDENRAQANAYVEQATSLPLPQFVFNTVTSAVTPTEIMTVIALGQRPLALLVMNPVMAKTFALSLLDRVSEYEEMSGGAVKTVSEIVNRTVREAT